MFIEFLDQLRCTQPHDDSWLVASFAERDGRFIVAGTLGCPICYRQYQIVAGVAYFDIEQATIPLAAPPVDPEQAMRAAALLGARERSTLVLGGAWATQAHGVASMLPLRIFAVNPAAAIEETEQVSIVRSSSVIPLTPHSIDGIALDETTATPSMLASALAVLRPGGRLVAPASAQVPAGIRELARDDLAWVGEIEPPLIALRRG